MKKFTTFLSIGLLATVLAVSGCIGQNPNVTGKATDADNTVPLGNTVVVEASANGFSPDTVTIKKGDTVKWVNKGSDKVWPASAMHPTHTVYPGANYSEEGSFMGSQACKAEGDSKDGAFDSCKGILPGGSYSFTFSQVGSWKYHDHLNPSFRGTVIVTE